MSSVSNNALYGYYDSLMKVGNFKTDINKESGNVKHEFSGGMAMFNAGATDPKKIAGIFGDAAQSTLQALKHVESEGSALLVELEQLNEILSSGIKDGFKQAAELNSKAMSAQPLSPKELQEVKSGNEKKNKEYTNEYNKSIDLQNTLSSLKDFVDENSNQYKSMINDADNNSQSKNIEKQDDKKQEKPANSKAEKKINKAAEKQGDIKTLAQGEKQDVKGSGNQTNPFAMGGNSVKLNANSNFSKLSFNFRP